LRLDELCMERFPQYSRTLIQSWILQGIYSMALTSLMGLHIHGRRGLQAS
jgi:hypothetical protein